MKTIYPLKSKQTRRISRKLIFPILFFLILSAFFYLFPNGARTFLYKTSVPIWFVRDGSISQLQNIKNYFVTKGQLIEDKEFLEKTIEELNLRQVDYDQLVLENQDLRESLDSNYVKERVIANILSKPPRSPYDTFIIDVGEDSGVKIGNKVFASDKVIVGQIKELVSDYSIVELYSNSGVKPEVTVQRTGATFTLTGHGGANFVLDIPKDTDVVWGDVFTFPHTRDPVLGLVYYIDENSQSAFKTVYIKMPGNVFSLQRVYVEK